MLVLKVNFSCKLCGNKRDFYYMPVEEQTIDKEKVQSLNKYHLRCKECGQKYLFKFNIDLE